MSLEIINQQGAQVVALRQQNAELMAVVNLLASQYVPSSKTFSRADVEKSQNVVVRWRAAKNGSVTITVTRKKEKK